ncbi:hypothetical protein KEM52_001063 [Ascosphaera acerosa]|nr:hypothetical protein KEM52_001063 [Ascosphaera acerosa]
MSGPQTAAPSRGVLAGAKGIKSPPTAATSRATAVPTLPTKSAASGPSAGAAAGVPASAKVHAQAHTRSHSSSTSRGRAHAHRYTKSSSSSASSSGPDAAVLTATTDRATVALINRVLAPRGAPSIGGAAGPGTGTGTGTRHSSLDPSLPPLSSSNKVDLQLYALLAIIVKEYIDTWYSKITPDTTLTDEIVRLVAHCTRAIEQRIRNVDVNALLLDEVPALLENHIQAFRTATETSATGPNTFRFRTVYHTLNPHPAFSPVPNNAPPTTSGCSPTATQRERECQYRQLLSQAVLAVLLPTEDLENAPLRTILADILADLILGGVIADRLCQEYFVYQYLAKACDLIRQRVGPAPASKDADPAGLANGGGDSAKPAAQPSQLLKFGLLGRPDAPEEPAKAASKHNASNALVAARLACYAWLWSVFQGVYLLVVAIRFIGFGLYKAHRAAGNPAATGPGKA